jgi:hypothetical protein
MDHGMKRRASDIAVVVSLAIALFVAAVWIRGLFTRDELVAHAFGRKCTLAVFPHHVYLIAFLAPAGGTPAQFRTSLKQYPSRPIYWEFRYHHRRSGTLRLGIPFWLPLSFAMAAPIWWLIERSQTSRRGRGGLCRECGYDLRASRDRCPECGTPILEDRRGGGAAENAQSVEAFPLDPSKRYATTRRWQISLKS